MNWTTLIQNRYASNTLINGEYFVIRFTPDFVANESFNIGVAFIDQQDIIHSRILTNLKGFECLYGSKSIETLLLLFHSLEKSLHTIGYVSTISPHINYSPLLTVSGLSVEMILNSLYQDYVHLDHYQTENNQKKLPSLNTSDLRSGLFSYLKKNNKALYDSYVCHDKVELKSTLNPDKLIKVELPIWRKRTSDLFKQEPLFATVVSADYIDEAALSLNLDYLGSTCIRNACEITGHESKAGLFIYRPSINERITPEALDTIDSHIDSTLHSLRRMKDTEGYNIDIEVLDSKEEIFDKIESFIV